MFSFLRWVKLLKLKLVRQTGSHQSIALGTVIGLMVGMIIPMGGQTIIALFLSWVMRVNKVAACTFTFISNPWSVIFIYPFQIWLGGLISGITISQVTIDNFILAGKQIKIFELDFSEMGHFLAEHGNGIMINFIIGGTIIGLLLSVAAYPLVIRFLRRHCVRRLKRQQARAIKRQAKLAKMKAEGMLPHDFPTPDQ